ncbi:MAG: histidine phosphatase family protein [Janthinobacterium lividum]
MANRILLLCAGATPGLRQGRFPASGANDAPDALGTPDVADALDALDALDEHAHAAATAARTRLADLQWTHGAAFSSPAAAARQTAAALGLAPRVDAALRDVDYGEWRARSLKDIAREDPERLRAWLTDVTAAPPAGESFVQVVARVDAWLDALLAAPVNGPASLSRHTAAAACAQASVLVVTHPAVIRAAALRGVGMSLGTAVRLDIAPLSIMTLERRQDAWMPVPAEAHSQVQSR